MMISFELKRTLSAALGLTACISALNGQTAFSPPDGGWDYLYEGAGGEFADEFLALDGKWSHANGSDQWDGSEIGGELGPDNAPGGAMVIEEGGVDYLRIQDPGDPRDHGFSDPTNRKVYFGYDLTADGVSDTILDDGVTIYFRARVPTDGPLDPLHRDGQPEPTPYPEGGDGYVVSDQGKGNFVIKQASGGALTFVLSTAADTSGGDPNGAATGFAGLSMNEFNGNQVSAGVNFGAGQGQPVVPLDPTEWHEFWITIQKDEGNVGTHTAFIYVDGDTNPSTFDLTAGTGDDYGGISYLAMGSSATPQNSALDVDFFGYKVGIVPPVGASTIPPPDIGNVSPALGHTTFSPSDGIRFAATTVGSIPKEGINVVLNGRDVSSNLQITGNDKRWEVSLSNLTPNVLYEGEISVTDSEGTTVKSDLDFDTFGASNNTIIEAEDFNFDGGEFIDDPVVSYDFEDPLINYNDLEGLDGIDTLEIDCEGGGIYRYCVGTAENSDFARPQYEGFADLDRSVTDILDGEWLNYTRTLPAGEYTIVARLSSIPPDTADFNFAVIGDPFVAQVDLVTRGATTENQALQKIGTFAGSTIVRNDAQTYEYFFLTDDDGNIATFTAAGVTTFRVTNNSVGYLANYYVVIPAADLPSSQPAVPATLSISGSGTDITITWDEAGTLEAASSVTGPWVEVGGASSPYSTTASEGSTFYRVVGN